MAESTTPADPTKARDWLYARGEKLIGSMPPPEPVVQPATPPAGFPPSTPLDTITFSDWSQYVNVQGVSVARVSSAADVAAVCNWAVTSGYKVRALGKSHNWSPILMAPGTPANPQVMLVDTTKLDECSFAVVNGVPLATFGTGITIAAATAYLETLNNNGTGAAPGYALPHMTAPGHLTLGGILAIGGHGTLLPSGTNEPDLMGCLSNLIVGFDAVVTDPAGPTPNTYTVRHFERTETDAAAFLVHLGRAVVTAVTLRVVPNYYLQLTCHFPNAADLFAPPPSSGPPTPGTLAALLDTHGRVEVLWFPYTLQTFVQCNRLQTTKIQPQVSGPWNYPWMNDISLWENALIKAALFAEPWATPIFTFGEFALADLNLAGKVLNGTARDLEIYLRDTTLRVTLFGWALQLPRAQVQQVASQFFTQVKTMLDTEQALGRYPINAAMEIRCTTIDRQDALPVPSCPPPALAATHSVTPQDPTLDTVIWLNLGTITGTAGSNEFYTALETWLLQTWGTQQPTRLRPEWSKAWAYTSNGPWTNATTIQAIRAMYNQPTTAPFTFQWAANTLAQYDAAHLFTNPLLEALFSP
jgi:hypothetical protein